jgi:6-phosphogluconolactonase
MAAAGMRAATAAGPAHGQTFDTPDDLAQYVADWVVARAVASADRFAFCLSGGSTPKRIYELLAAAPRRALFPWHRTHFFWGDERFVPHDDPQSNFRMAFDALLAHAPVPAENIHPIPTEGGSAASCAAQYQAALVRFYGAAVFDAARPLFDLTLLGLGEDGHLASLFPASPELSEAQRWAVPVVGERVPDRITLTYPALASSAAAAFLVTGAHKRGALSRVRAGDLALPAARLRPVGELYWFTDRDAAPPQ